LTTHEPVEADAAGLAAEVLGEEDRRTGPSGPATTVVPDDMLPGVGGASMSLREALRIGGRRTIVVLGLAQIVEEVSSSGFAVLAPDIQRSLSVSDAVLGAIGGAFGILFLAGSVPISSLADRYPRTKVAAVSIAVWSVMVALTGAVQNAFQLFVARLGSGLGRSYQLPVANPLIVDTYPIESRGRVFALDAAFGTAGRALAPLIAGGLAALLPGDNSWRWVFLVTAIAGLPVALLTGRLTEPRRGRHEMRAVLGDELAERDDELPISLGVAFERLKKIRTFYFFLVGMASLGFALFTIPLFLNLVYEDDFGLSAFQRGLLSTGISLPGFVALAIVGRRTDDLFRRSPPASLVLIGLLVASFGGFVAMAVNMRTLWLLAPLLSIGTALAYSSFAVVTAPIAAVIPYRLRSRGVAMIGVYTFLFGSFFGAVLTGLLSDAIGRRGAITTVVLPSTLIGGALIAYGARFVRGDVSRVVEELREEQDEAERVARPEAEVPVIQVRNLDFSYGNVQVLFDVDLDVHAGEVLALLGTNGAGKSTLLRVISGLGVPDRGVVRFNGRTVTYAEPELRSRLGIVQLVGGGATFGPLSIEENLRMAGYAYPAAEVRGRIDRVLESFPMLRDRLDVPAEDLSGGQQQLLALAMTLIREPEVLIIDELSLGLAPVVVQQVLDIVRGLKDGGMTMIIVEQSLNVALAIADRAIFMEKGQIRFEGPAEELAARDDLARAVFLGS
jgi:ABC-type branched-subunit amino acid transport system ATPase component/predicted MFS family arabinose efflux permease